MHWFAHASHFLSIALSSPLTVAPNSPREHVPVALCLGRFIRTKRILWDTKRIQTTTLHTLTHVGVRSVHPFNILEWIGFFNNNQNVMPFYDMKESRGILDEAQETRDNSQTDKKEVSHLTRCFSDMISNFQSSILSLCVLHICTEIFIVQYCQGKYNKLYGDFKWYIRRYPSEECGGNRAYSITTLTLVNQKHNSISAFGALAIWLGWGFWLTGSVLLADLFKRKYYAGACS